MHSRGRLLGFFFRAFLLKERFEGSAMRSLSHAGSIVREDDDPSVIEKLLNTRENREETLRDFWEAILDRRYLSQEFDVKHWEVYYRRMTRTTYFLC